MVLVGAGAGAGIEEGLNQRAGVRLVVKGVVQGVGFRPFVFKTAEKLGVAGVVWNAGQGVVIEAEGNEESLRVFVQEISLNPPPLARITSVSQEKISPRGYSGFTILDSSDKEATKEALVPPDVGLCPDCRREVLDPRDRHYLYAFTNCTNCGPRFTIVKEVPYDRAKTSMASFEMCAECEREYHEPRNRRFHAQPIACPACGPQLELVDGRGQRVPGDWYTNFVSLIKAGSIIAVKSLGGFHLACDAYNAETIRELRRRKGRPRQALAIMCRDLEVVQRICHVSAAEAEVLASREAPIVVLRQREDCSLPRELNPGLYTLGVMLPYTPLHLLLFRDLDILVMTSGNYHELPLARDNLEALTGLRGIADYFLWHNRQVINRCDDSVVQVMDEDVLISRRSRGYVPVAIRVPVENQAGFGVLGCGGEMKNTFCLIKGNEAYVSQHIGEMDIAEGGDNFRESLEGLGRLLGLVPRIIAYDLHPDYRSSALARSLPADYKIAVQHHHAHMCSCMAENGLDEPVVGAILDGTGYGTDGNAWGFEILAGDYSGFRREMHLRYIPLPGGERAVRYPWLTAVAYITSSLKDYGEEYVEEWCRRLFGHRGRELEVVRRMLALRFNCPLASSAGRLFDAVAAILGVAEENTYEGEAAISLGELAMFGGLAPEVVRSYPFRMTDEELDPGPVIDFVLGDLERGVDKRLIALQFHQTVAEMVAAGVRAAAQRSGLKKVVLSGGTWQNGYLLRQVKQLLAPSGLEVYQHHRVPTNDGGISLGQAVIACWRWQNDVHGRSRPGVSYK